jgi:hypothetical protein
LNRFRPARRRLGLATVALVLLCAPALILVTADARATAGAAPQTGISCTGSVVTTCTQTDPTHFAYIPAVAASKGKPGHPGGTETVAPSVTVSQTSNLVYQTVQVSWQNFTPSFDQDGAAGADQTTLYGVIVYECRGSDPQVPPAPNNDGAPEDCYNANQDHPLLGEHGLGNAVDAFTAPDGTGQADIAVETSTENDLLGCSTSVSCSLAIVPNWGGQQTTNPVSCTNHNHDTSATAAQASVAATGAPCSWADRITVPLTFAATPANCTGTAGFSSEGSPMLEQAMQRWRPSWCTGAHALNLNYDSGTTEAQARQDFTTPPSALSESTDVAFTSLPATSAQAAQRAFTYAPIANSGVVIAFEIDDPATGQQLTHVTLDARLVAKMLTESYALKYSQPVCVLGAPTATQQGCGAYNNDTDSYASHDVPCTASMPQSATCDPAVAGNPTSIVADPEFRALNPTLFPAGEPAQISASEVNLGEFLPILAGGNTDVTYALTNWIESDPDARSFLAGAQDGYGMHVNSYYKGNTDWPSGQVEQLDPGYSSSTNFAGFGTMQVALNPVESLDSTVQSLLASEPTDTDTVNYGPTGCNVSQNPADTVDPPCSYSRQGSLNPGARVLFAVMDAADADNFGFPTATLVNSAGIPVTADSQSISAAVHDVTANSDGITTSPDYAQMLSDPAAYPIAVTDYAMVPTCKTSAPTASSIVDFLHLTAGTTAQTTGLIVGDLSPGYAPLSSTQIAQANKAADEVAAQDTCLATISSTTTATGSATAPLSAGASADSNGTTGAQSSSSGKSAAEFGTGVTSSGATPAGAELHALPPNNTLDASSRPGTRGGIGAGPIGLLLVLVVVGFCGLLVAGPGTWWVSNTAMGAAVFAWIRRGAGR